MCKLFAVGISSDFDEPQLAQLFAPFGGIELLTIVQNKANGGSKGYAFIHMKTQRGAEGEITTLSGHPFGDR